MRGFLRIRRLADGHPISGPLHHAVTVHPLGVDIIVAIARILPHDDRPPPAPSKVSCEPNLLLITAGEVTAAGSLPVQPANDSAIQDNSITVVVAQDLTGCAHRFIVPQLLL